MDDLNVGHNLDTLRGPLDYVQASKNADLVEKLEKVVDIWCRQIDQVRRQLNEFVFELNSDVTLQVMKQVLAESEQMRKEADDIGPAAELEHWRQRMSKFNALLDEIKTPRVNVLFSFL